MYVCVVQQFEHSITTKTVSIGTICMPASPCRNVCLLLTATTANTNTLQYIGRVDKANGYVHFVGIWYYFVIFWKTCKTKTKCSPRTRTIDRQVKIQVSDQLYENRSTTTALLNCCCSLPTIITTVHDHAARSSLCGWARFGQNAWTRFALHVL